MPFYERDSVKIHYQEVGSGFPLLIIPGGGLNASLPLLETSVPFNPMETYKNDFRCISADLRNATPGQSEGPLEGNRPWAAAAGRFGAGGGAAGGGRLCGGTRERRVVERVPRCTA